MILAVSAGIFAAYRAPGAAIASPAVFWAGCALFAGGIALRWHSIIHLGRFFTVNVAIHSRHEIIDTGPYKLVRHPSYAGALLASLGFALTLRNWLALALVMVPIAWAFGRRIATEEAALASALGLPYTNYMQRTRRLVPYIY
jgi:protein-S-isoprenylcysteine O-methyltransferase